MESNLKKRKIRSNLKSLFSAGLWKVDTSNSTKSWRRMVRFVKLVRITFTTFAENRMGFQCVSLSYFMTLAFIPFIAFVFFVSGGLGLESKVLQLINSIPTGNTDFLNLLVDKAGNIISTAKSGVVGFVSALTFFWSILWMMFQVERVFNNVWGIRKVPRKMYKRFSFYLLVLLILPFLILIFGFGIFYYSRIPAFLGIDVESVKFITELLGYIIMYILCALTFAVMYKYIPAPKIRFYNALKAAAVSSLAFLAFQYIYMETQVFVTRINGVYGALAAIPLFLIWLNFSWQIIIYGAELTYGLENIDSYKID